MHAKEYSTDRDTPRDHPDRLDQVAAVIPCYNAGPHAKSLIKTVSNIVGHTIVIDDGSTDGSLSALDSGQAALLAFDRNQGKGAALITGLREALRHADINCIATIDADGQHDPAELPGLYHVFRENQADLLIGARFQDAQAVPFRSRIGNQATVLLTSLLFGTRIPDTQSGYRLLSRAFVEDIVENVAGGRYETEMEILARALAGGLTIVSVPIRTIYEPGNRSSHFNWLRDPIRIYARLFSTALRKSPEANRSVD